MDDPRVSEVNDVIQANSGWVLAGLLGVWGWLLRLVLGRHLKAVDRVEGKMDDLIERVARIEGKLENE